MTPPYIDFGVNEDTGTWDLFFMAARDEFGDPTLPEVAPAEFLEAYERKNPMDFQAQMMNEPGEGGHMPLTRRDIETMWVDRRDLPGNLRYSIHCDTAFKDRKAVGKGDFSVIQLWGHSQNGSGEVYYLWGARSNRWSSQEFGEQLVKLIQQLKQENKRAFALTDERGMGGKEDMMAGMIWNWCSQAGMVAPPVQLLSRIGAKKEMRIRQAAGYWANGKVHLVRDAPEVGALVQEMLRIGVSSHDDMADAAADVFHEEIYTVERLFGGDPESPVVRHPYDDILQLPLESMTDENVRVLYDRAQEDEKFKREIASYQGDWELL